MLSLPTKGIDVFSLRQYLSTNDCLDTSKSCKLATNYEDWKLNQQYGPYLLKLFENVMAVGLLKKQCITTINYTLISKMILLI